MSRRDNRGARSLHCRGYDINRIGERDLRNVFSSFGKVIDVYLPKNYFTKELRGFAYIQFEKDDDADSARQKLDRTDVFQDDHMVNIMWAAGERKTPTDMRRLDIELDNPHARRERDRNQRMEDRSAGEGGRYNRYERDEEPYDRFRDDRRPRHGFGGRGGRGYSRSPPRRRLDRDDGRRHDRYERRSISPDVSRKRVRDESPGRAPVDGGRRDFRGRSRSRSRSPVRRRISSSRYYKQDEDRDRDRGRDRNGDRDGDRMQHRNGDRAGDRMEHRNGDRLEHRNSDRVEHRNGDRMEHRNGEHMEHRNGENMEHRNGEHMEHRNGEHMEHRNGDRSEERNEEFPPPQKVEMDDRRYGVNDDDGAQLTKGEEGERHFKDEGDDRHIPKDGEDERR